VSFPPISQIPLRSLLLPRHQLAPPPYFFGIQLPPLPPSSSDTSHSKDLLKSICKIYRKCLSPVGSSRACPHLFVTPTLTNVFFLFHFFSRLVFLCLCCYPHYFNASFFFSFNEPSPHSIIPVPPCVPKSIFLPPPLVSSDQWQPFPNLLPPLIPFPPILRTHFPTTSLTPPLGTKNPSDRLPCYGPHIPVSSVWSFDLVRYMESSIFNVLLYHSRQPRSVVGIPRLKVWFIQCDLIPRTDGC